MTLYIVLAVATVLACEIALRLPLVKSLTTLSRTAGRAKTVVTSSAISDTWKERVLPAYAGRILTSSLLLFACLVAIAVPVVIAAALATGSIGAGSAALLEIGPLIVMIAVGVAYISLRRRLVR